LRKIPSSAPVPQGPDNFPFGSVFGISIDYTTPENFQAFEETTTAVSLAKNPLSENNGLIYFPTTVAADATCTLAILNVTSSAAVTAEIYPVVHRWEPSSDSGLDALYRFQNRLYDEDIKTTAALAVGINTIDVTSLMPAVQTADTWGFLFRLVNEGESTNLDIDATLILELTHKD
jgi:hypothetical protein